MACVPECSRILGAAPQVFVGDSDHAGGLLRLGFVLFTFDERIESLFLGSTLTTQDLRLPFWKSRENFCSLSDHRPFFL